MARLRKIADPAFGLSKYLAYYLAHILHRYDLNMVAELHSHQLNNSAWRVLSTLNDRPDMTIKDLSRYTVLERSFVSRIVTGLAERGLVNRQVPDDNRRIVLVSLSPAGRRTLHEIMLPIVRDQLDAAFRDVSDADRTHLLTTLTKVMDNVYRAAREVPPTL